MLTVEVRIVLGVLKPPRVRGVIVDVWHERVAADIEPTARMLVEYAPGYRLDVPAARVLELARENPRSTDKAERADPIWLLLGRKVSFLALPSSSAGIWTPQQPCLDREPPRFAEAASLPSGNWVYIIGPADRTVVKIGRSTNLYGRLMCFQAGSMVPLLVFCLLPGGAEVETRLHRQFAALRQHGEMFRVSGLLSAFLNRSGLDEPIPLVEPGGPIVLSDNPPDMAAQLRRVQAQALGFPPPQIRRADHDSSPLPRAKARVAPPPPGGISVEAEEADREIDEAVLKVVLDHPGELSEAGPAHILWGSRGPVTRRYADHVLEYGALSQYDHRYLRARTKRLIARGDLRLVDGRLAVSDSAPVRLLSLFSQSDYPRTSAIGSAVRGPRRLPQ